MAANETIWNQQSHIFSLNPPCCLSNEPPGALRIPRPPHPSLSAPASPSLVTAPSSLSSSTAKALAIPELVLLIQEQLLTHRPSLLVSLRVSRLWFQAGHHLVWQIVDWDNTLEWTHQEDVMVQQAHRIKTLRCMFHSQAGTVSNADSSSLLRAFVGPLDAFDVKAETRVETDDDIITSTSGSDVRDIDINTLTNEGHNNIDIDSANNNEDNDMRSSETLDNNTKSQWPVPRRRLQQLYLKGHFDLRTIASTSSTRLRSDLLPLHSFISFNIPSLTRLDIRPSVNSAVDIHLILDSASRLQHLVIHSHGAFVNSKKLILEQIESESKDAKDKEVVATFPDAHHSLLSLSIQHLKISREELEGVLARCPGLIELQSICSPGNLWKSRSQYQLQTLVQESTLQQIVIQSKSLVCTVADACPNIQRFHIGLQQGGLHVDSIRETLKTFPRLESLGIPAWDCTKVTMDAIKAVQVNAEASLSGMRASSLLSTGRVTTAPFLTKLCIMNVCSSEKVSLAIHEYLCWTPYLKEFYAYNTTLYIEQMQVGESSASDLVCERHGSVDHDVATLALVGGEQEQQMSVDGSQLIPEGFHHPYDTHANIGLVRDASFSSSVSFQEQEQGCNRQWACVGLERLVVRFAHLPWRNLAEPPARSKDTFAFLGRLQNLKHLCIKEGLMLEAGREYEALGRLKGLEELVFTTCYPIPIKPRDMEWMMDTDSSETMINHLKMVVVRRQKANAAMDREMNRWFKEHRPDLTFIFELTDCCEEEYSFQH